MERINKPQIRVNSTSHRAATKAAAACHLTLGEYTEAALDYFTSRQLNPVDNVAREGQLIRQQVKKLGDRVFGYLQEEERSLLIPMLEEMLRSRITLERVLRLNEILVNQLTQQLSGYTEHQLAAQRESLQQLRQQNEAMIERQVNDAVASARATASGQPTRPSR
jgi:hypothetical protein